MMNIVERLRSKDCCSSENCNCDEAADEIERLRDENEKRTQLHQAAMEGRAVLSQHLAESQAREAKLRDALRNITFADEVRVLLRDTPTDDSALREMIEAAKNEERETITEEWVSRVQSDLEHGVKSLNEAAAEKWRKEFPLVSTFGLWLEGEEG